MLARVMSDTDVALLNSKMMAPERYLPDHPLGRF